MVVGVGDDDLDIIPPESSKESMVRGRILLRNFSERENGKAVGVGDGI
jgi:hypothetical protein